ncbi:mitochondrial amidoxime reducing component 2 isoform X2 [Harpegnathos saltator]|uniref:mitochondrial amidoxime reducing component 2 isoform X2 n=1 Tax=Harpegnathos saltator TaxID=610380 RepID=UPI000590237D|nr:mitochondrial amidoxime reducing component 2 isoform X2 [Harpegnathos saltator]
MSVCFISNKPSINKNSWILIGKVVNICGYPVSSGHPEYLEEIGIGHNGVFIDKNLWDNMFVVYHEQYKYIYDRTNAILSHMVVKVPKNNTKKLELEILDVKLTLDMNEVRKNEQVKCTQSLNNRYISKKNYYDCGDEAANWLYNSLKDVHARLGFRNPIDAKATLQDTFNWLYPSVDYDEIKIQNPSNPPSCRLMSLESFNNVKENMDSYINMTDFGPNIIIQTKTAYKEDGMEWFKIGKVILRTLRPPLKSDEDATFHVPMEMRLQLLSLHCETYMAGIIQLGDKVYTLKNFNRK